MKKTFSELVIEGNFTLVKGFLMGFICGFAPESKYFFHRKTGIVRRDTILGLVKEFLEVEDYVYISLEDSIIDDFKKAVDVAEGKIGIQIKDIKTIKSAEFKFSFEIFNEKLAGECKAIFSNPPHDIDIIDFKPVEKIDKDAPSIGYRSERHPYHYKGKGIVKGDFDDIIELFMKCKRCKCSQFLECDEVNLNFE